MSFARHVGSVMLLAVGGISLSMGCTSGDAASPTPSAPTDGSVPDGTTVGDEAGHDGGVHDAARAETSDDEDGPVSGACTSYCVQMMDVCTGSNVQFPTIGTCFNACRYYPPGDPSDTIENSLTCRAFHLVAGSTSAEDADGHCLHSGIYGYGGCGNPCDPFCTIAMDWCGKSASGALFASMTACQTECATWLDEPGPSLAGVAYNADGPTTGNTRDCRQYHLTTSLRSKADRDTHCPLAGANSTACR